MLYRGVMACSDGTARHSRFVLGTLVVALVYAGCLGSEHGSEHGTHDMYCSLDDPPPGTVAVAGCAVPCTEKAGCAGSGTVNTVNTKTGKPLWDPTTSDFTGSQCPSSQPSPLEDDESLPNMQAGKCGDFLAPGTNAQLKAMASQGSRFEKWVSGRGESAGFSCPCAGSTIPECSFVVAEHVYCGAVFSSGI